MSAMIKDINFLPERIILARKKRRNCFLYAAAAFLALVVIGGAVCLPFLVVRDYQSRLAGVNQMLGELEPAKPYYEEKVALQQELHKKEMALQDIGEKHLNITQMLKYINEILPGDCYVSALSVKAGEEFNIQVVTNSPIETARVLVGLRQMEVFEEVSLSGVGDVPFAAGPQPVDFKLKFVGVKADIK
ncbi:PilN domain-containing protein [Desulfolucanica intricata]|uniref:PilN domain-containing protein n=1 Tax=Desulfolucanica intricata TaxID=1285191 RepID=UPI00082F0800|nr:hypothetical protein [Desulfolucanica intricata]